MGKEKPPLHGICNGGLNEYNYNPKAFACRVMTV